ncbi:MAG: hypothetical protein QOG68_2265 [Solirubrobacteraceae bacterium]|jgi:hypothetical protein|nr:hypothetical protein [Solirubrobacteraceae bacterium]
MRKVVGTIICIAIAVAGVIGLISFFDSRDSSTTGGGAATLPDPGVTAPAAAGGLVRSGNVVLTFSDPTFAAKLRTLASDLGAPDSPELRAAGQAVVVRRDPKAGGVVATAYKHTLSVASPADTRLQDFIERWLGQPASG